MNETVERVLEHKGDGIEAVPPHTTVLDAVQRMNDRKIGSLLVMDRDRLVGIFTERDVLTRVVARAVDQKKVLVGEVMTRQVLTIPCTTTVEEAMIIMTDTRRRHIPVLRDGVLVGLVSIGDLTRFVVRDQQRTIDDLTDFVRRS